MRDVTTNAKSYKLPPCTYSWQGVAPRHPMFNRALNLAIDAATLSFVLWLLHKQIQWHSLQYNIKTEREILTRTNDNFLSDTSVHTIRYFA